MLLRDAERIFGWSLRCVFLVKILPGKWSLHSGETLAAGAARQVANLRFHLLQLQIEGAFRDAEQASGLPSVSVRVAESREDCLSLQLAETLRSRQGSVDLLLAANSQREVVNVNNRREAQGNSLLNAVLELTDVPGPIVFGECG